MGDSLLCVQEALLNLLLVRRLLRGIINICNYPVV